LVGLDGTPEQPPRADDVLLAGELVQRPRPHPCGQGRFALDLLLAGAIKEVHAGIVPEEGPVVKSASYAPRCAPGVPCLRAGAVPHATRTTRR